MSFIPEGLRASASNMPSNLPSERGEEWGRDASRVVRVRCGSGDGRASVTQVVSGCASRVGVNNDSSSVTTEPTGE